MDRAQTELSLLTAGNILHANHFWYDARFLIGLSCERDCPCLFLVVGFIGQRIGKRNYLGMGAWEIAGKSTRGRGVVSF